MTTANTSIDLTNMSSVELEQLLQQRKLEEAERRQEAKTQYESERDRIVKFLVETAKGVQEQLADFKKSCHDTFDDFRDRSLEYGDIRSHSKGGFSLRTSDGKMMARLERNVIHEYDERADLALGLIKEFLESTIKKKDISTYRLISKLIERNKSGDLKPERVASFLSIKNNYSDERWVKAMTLLEESYREREVSYNVAFYEKDELGKDQPIILTFASL
ncbi:MAG: DUF3164 family protein [Chitinophagales bacterium]|nr:DUF3164 family protein [Chitinophagales bacterium]